MTTSRMKAVALTLVVFMSIASARDPYAHDGCLLMPNPGPAQGTTLDLMANKTCDEGSIWWNYPQGDLRVTFARDPSSDFQVCLPFKGSSYNFQAMFDYTDGSNPKEIPKPSAGHPFSCVKSRSGIVVLEFQEHRTLRFYMTMIFYDIRSM